MSRAIDKLYINDPVNEKHKNTDALFSDDCAKVSYRGLIHDAIDFVEKSQLLDSELWKRFVLQFRENADGGDRGWRGEYWGKMMRGACFTYSCTRDERLYEVLTESVEDMLLSEDSLGRISTYPISSEKVFGELDGWDIWCRKYVLLGMQYYLEICRDEDLKKRITESLCRQTDYLISKLGDPSEGKKRITEATRNWRGLNSSSLLEPVVRLYSLTGEKRLLDFADYIIGEGGTCIFNIFEAALEDITDPYQYPITKAYEMMSCFEGILEYYHATGIEKYKTIALNFARRVALTDVTIIGCCGTSGECFDHSSARQTDSSENGHKQETCVTVTWMKFCMKLLLLTADPAFADRFEQSLYNAYLGALNTENNMPEEVYKSEPRIKHRDFLPFDSYSPLLGGTRGQGVGGLRIMKDGHYYGCCACIGAAGAGMISKTATMISEKGIAVNLYIPGTTETMTPSGDRIIINCETEYPADGRIKLKLELEHDEQFEIKLRIPAWSEKNILTVAGEKIDASRGYTAVERVWKNGDIIELELDMRTKLLRPASNPRDIIITKVVWGYDYLIPRIMIPSSDSEYRFALRRGPLVLARDARLGEDIFEKNDIASDADDYVDAELSNGAKFPKIVELKATTADGKKITLVDFASAGKTWDERSKYLCWLPSVKNYAKNNLVSFSGYAEKRQENFKH